MMKKVINLLTLLVMVSVNTITPFTYADIETGDVVDIGELTIIEESIDEISEENNNTPTSGDTQMKEQLIEVMEPELVVEAEIGSGNVVLMSGLNNDVDDEYGIIELSGGNNIEEIYGENIKNENLIQEARHEIGIFGGGGLENVGMLSTSSQDIVNTNSHIVYDEENRLITVYTGDYSYGITFQDRNFGAENIGDNGDFYLWGRNEKITDLSNMDFSDQDNNIWGGDGDLDREGQGYDFINHKVINPEQRRGLCPKGFHIPSKGEAEHMALLVQWAYKGQFDYYSDLKLPYGGLIVPNGPSSAVINSTNLGFFHLSSGATGENKIRIFGYKGSSLQGGWCTENCGLPIRCFKDEYIPYSKIVKYHPNGGAFSGMGINETKEYTYDYSGSDVIPIYNIQIPDRVSENPSQQSGWMFDGWYTKTGLNEDWGEEFDINNPQSTVAYAKWLPFNDLTINGGGISFTIMDRNLGATGNNRYYEDSFGKYFQWGNNYGFKNEGNLTNIQEELVSNPDNEENPWGPGNYYYNNKYIIRNIAPFRRHMDDNDNLWGGENYYNSDINKKGPCPNGYHIPSIYERRIIKSALSKENKKVVNEMQLPQAGYRAPYDSSKQSEVRYYRSSTPYTNNNDSYYFYLAQGPSNDQINLTSTTYRHFGMSVRCFKNSEKTNRLIINKNNGDDVEIHELKRWESIGKYLNYVENSGFTFSGWKYETSGNDANDEDYIVGETNIFANWSKNPWYEFNAKGGLFANKMNIKILKSAKNNKKLEISLKENPGMNNYRYEYKINGAKNLFITINKHEYNTNHTLYFYTGNKQDTNITDNYIFKSTNEFPISFKINGDSLVILLQQLGAPVNTEITIIGDLGYSIEESIENPINSGYTFSGRYESGAVEPFDFTGTEITQDRAFYAKWNPHHYTIKFDINGGKGEVSDISAIYGEEVILPNISKEGYIFKGWKDENGKIYTNKIGKSESLTTEDGVIVILMAQWEESNSNHSSGGGKKSQPTASEVTNDTTQEHNSADNSTVKPTDTTTAPLNEETTKEVISVTQEIAEDGTEVEVVVEAVAIKNTNIVATVRTETPVNGTTSSTYSSSAHTQEQADAYSFAKANGITTTESIETAKMNTELTRIQMAKMLSNFAINVLGEEPDVSKGTVKFDDVTNKMDEQYDNAVTKAYQLGIMGQNVKDNEFRPNDGVTRAEFTTALSRLLYKIDEGEYKGTSKYYIPHLVKLYNEGIVNKTDPKIKEKRGYVMTMLKRTVE